MDKLEIINRIGYIKNRAGLSQKALSLEIDMNSAYIARKTFYQLWKFF